MGRMAVPDMQAQRNFVYRAVPALFAPLDSPETIRSDVAVSLERIAVSFSFKKVSINHIRDAVTERADALLPSWRLPIKPGCTIYLRGS